MGEEIWKEIFVGYLVSNFGNVDSLKGGVRKRLRLHVGRDGYLRVSLFVDGKAKTFTVHRLVAHAFIPNPQNLPQVNHINGIKTDNRVENLEWVTVSKNNQHAFDTGLKKSGAACSFAKLSNEQVIYVRENPDHLTTYELAEKFGVTQAAICRIQLGKTYKNAGGTIHVARAKKYKPRVPDAQRAEICRRYKAGGVSQATLAKEFGHGEATIWRIINGK